MKTISRSFDEALRAEVVPDCGTESAHLCDYIGDLCQEPGLLSEFGIAGYGLDIDLDPEGRVSMMRYTLVRADGGVDDIMAGIGGMEVAVSNYGTEAIIEVPEPGT